MMNEKVKELQDIIDHARHVVFFTGAGVSTDSGIPDFRSQDGLYNQEYKYPPEEIISHHFFMNDPEEFYRFYKNKMLCLDAEPNYVHKYIAQLEKRGKSLGVVTQNIDGLHQKAGSKRVYELHGSIMRNYCEECGKYYPAEFIKNCDGVPKCEVCGSIIKPDVVLYEEPLDDECIRGAINAIRKADLLIICGTSLNVYPATSFVGYFNGSTLAIINRDETMYDNNCDIVIHDDLVNTFKQLSI